ncbi:hypothetical protein ACFLS9_09080 [Bacteroidota bacterium]
MKRSKHYLLLLLFSVISISAQNKNFSIEDVVLNSNTSLAPTSLKQLKWIPGENSYSYIEDRGDYFTLVKGYASSGKKEELVSLDLLSSKLNNYDIESPSEFPKFSWLNRSKFYFWKENHLFLYNLKLNDLSVVNIIPDKSEDINFAHDTTFFAFTKENNLFVSLSK